IEERPEAIAAERCLEAEIRESIQHIRKAFVPALARRHGDPQYRARAPSKARAQRSLGPALACEDLGVLRNIEKREFQTFFPDYQPFRTMHVGKALDTGGIVLGLTCKAEGIGERGFAFQDQYGPMLDSCRPF